MEVNNVSLASVAVRPSQYPTEDRPEIAFVGKSNVGKSSLINTMVNRKALARTSRSPGKTRTINFYNVEDMLYFVDLPGYGYAKLSKSETEKWGKMAEGYLRGRKTLKAITLLIDIRHEPGENDVTMYQWLKHYGYTIITVATKSDKIKRSQISKHIDILRNGLGLTDDESIIPFSSETRNGKQELWKIILTKADK